MIDKVLCWLGIHRWEIDKDYGIKRELELWSKNHMIYRRCVRCKKLQILGIGWEDDVYLESK
jgi:hypothetical protein